ncbi:coxsackievirus and adenovirus receptor homolog [Colossoma macropomum]|uniref:coxsackievirus and adenovirus receptor homolog n=1 Tax=Colossoma macropomum TaxID=42526 RepID=UPI001863D42A|nr:coxsackievirus and adenovirus receptor homolog [Colossoma macropomum]
MKLTTSALLCLLAVWTSGSVCGLEINSTGPTFIEKANGESVKLDCHFTLAAEDSGPLWIEWTIKPSDNWEEDMVVIVYSGYRLYENYYPPLKGRVHFDSLNPKNGDASINLLRLEASDTGSYWCKVKKLPGIRSRKVLLTVLVRPSKPRCSIEGSAQVGKDVVLSCKSSDGSRPLQYIWEKTSGSKVLPADAVLDVDRGIVRIRSATEAASGTYRCTAKNRVGADECVLELSITQPLDTVGVIAGSVTCVLLILPLIALISFCCCRTCRKKNYNTKVSNEIRY